MSSYTYTSLQAVLALYLNRPTSAAGMLIELVEYRLQQDLRIREMEVVASDTITGGELPVPTDYLELKSATLVTASKSLPLRRATVEYIRSFYPAGAATGEPKYMAQDGGNFIFGPTPDSDYTVNYTYYAAPTTLAVSGTTNVFLDKSPGLYIYAVMSEGSAYYGEHEQVPMWEGKYNQLVTKLNEKADEEKFSGGSFISTPLN